MSGNRDARIPPSCAWAMAKALQLRDAGSLPPALLFGLGGGAWFRLAGRGDRLDLGGLHPDRVKHGFYGLNVWSVCFKYLSADAEAQLRERCRSGLQTLLVVDPVALGDPEGVADEMHERIVLVTGMRSDTDGDVVTLCARQWPDGIELPLDTLRRAWFRNGPDGPAATFYWHPLVELGWNQREAIGRALKRFAHRMRASYPGSGANGLAGMRSLAGMRVPAASLQASASLLHDDGGAGLYRDHMADFLRIAAGQTECPKLLAAATAYDRAAALWTRLLANAADGGAALLDAKLLADIVAMEEGGLDAVEQACAMEGRQEHA